MAVNRTSHDGTVIVTSVARETVASAEDVQVRVDGEGAVRASTYGELLAATDGGDSSSFMVTERSGAAASADVLVGVNHFSTREVSVSGSEGPAGGSSETAGEDGDDAGTTSGAGPGFGVVAVLLALGISVALAHRRR